VEEIRKALAAMTNDAAIRLVMRWLAERKGKSIIMQLRMHNEDQSIMHYIGVRTYTQRVYFLYVQDLPSHSAQLLYVWKPRVVL